MKMTFPVPEDLLNFELDISPDEGEETYIGNYFHFGPSGEPTHPTSRKLLTNNCGGECVGRSALLFETAGIGTTMAPR